MSRRPPTFFQRVKAGVKAFRDLGMFDLTAGGVFRGADFNRLVSDWFAPELTADDVTRAGIATLRRRGRDLERNNPYMRQYLNLLEVNVIGPHGFGHQAQVRNNSGELARPLNDKIEFGWDDWSSTVTLDGKFGLNPTQRTLLRTVARDGDAFYRTWIDRSVPYGLRIELIQPECVDHMLWRRRVGLENEIRMGIEIDARGRPIAYHVWNDLTQPVAERIRNRIPADQIGHIYLPTMVNQTRGVSWVAAAMLALYHLDCYEEAELVASRAASLAQLFLEQKNPQDAIDPSPDAPEEMQLNPLSIQAVARGWGVNAVKAEHPTTAYPAFVKGQLRRIASALGVSYNALANDLEGVNYSSMRSGLLIERDLWRTLQQWWIGAFLQPLYERWLNVATLSGDLVLDSRDTSKFRAVRWSPRGWAWVDPLKETEAAVLAIQNGLGSRTDSLAGQGLDFEDMLDDLADEKDLAATKGVDITGPDPRPDSTVGEKIPATSDGAGGGNNSAAASGRHGKNGHNRLAGVTLGGLDDEA